MSSRSDEAGNAGKDAPGAAVGRCPICGKPRVQEYRPFCSKRCADIDLGRWLKGAYVVPDAAPSTGRDD